MTIGRAVLVAVLAASVILLAVVIGWEPDSETTEGPSSGIKVIIIGIDGADWFMLGRLLEEGVMVSLPPLLRRSVTGEIAADLPAVPDVGWTVMGRGMSLTETELARVRAGDGRLRGLRPELVKLVAEAGGDALSVGWPASWPAVEGRGDLVAPYTLQATVHGTGLTPALFEGGPDQTQNESFRARVDEIAARDLSDSEAEFRRLIFDGEAIGDGWEEHLLAARWALLADRIAIDVAASLIASEEPDLALVYLGGLDAVGHRFLGPAMPDYFTELPPESGAYSAVLPNYYAFIDGCIERVRRLTDENYLLIVCSAYGTHPSLDVPGLFGAHSNGPPGVLIARGPDMPPRPQPISLSTVDMAPTALAAIGVRIPTNLEGRVVPGMVPGGLLRAHPPVYTGTAEIEAAEPSAQSVSMMERLAEERLAFLREQMEGGAR
jgi:hypothetical protein